MLNTLLIVLVLLWLLGMVSSYTLGGFLHILLVLAIAVVFLLTPLRDSEWWTDSQGAPMAVAALKGLKPMLPERFGRYLPG